MPSAASASSWRASCSRRPSSAGTRRRPPAVDPEVAATVQRVLTSAEHHGLTWHAIPDVARDLSPLYAREPDHLPWLAGATPHPALAGTLAAIAAAGDHGLDPADYDADALHE